MALINANSLTVTELTEKPNWFVQNVKVVVGEAVLQQLLGHKMAYSNVQLFLVCVARNVYHFHAVEQRRRNGRQCVGGRYKQNLWQVERNIEIATNSFVMEQPQCISLEAVV